MGITVENGGILTTVQDEGRFGNQAFGVSTSGAMDPRAFHIANLLVGNKKTEGALEMTFIGPTLTFTSDNIIAVTGGDLTPMLDGQPFPMYKAVLVKKGQKLMFAGARKLDNLVFVVDNNGLQIDGDIEDVCSPYPLPDKFKAFNFHVIEIDAHDFEQIDAAFREARETKGMPTAIIAKSVKGKGVSFMENQASWHGSAPNDEQYAQAKAEVEAKLAELEGK